MEGDNLRRLYEQLDEMQQKAVSEAVWDKEGYFRADRFKAKYGGTPVFATKGTSVLSAIIGAARHGSVCFCLTMIATTTLGKAGSCRATCNNGCRPSCRARRAQAQNH